MAVPKKKVSLSRKKKRSTITKSKIKKSMCNYAICPNCTYLKKKHNVCHSCGYYSKNVIYKG